ncbi:MAG TPA: hypothetical protein PKH97_14515 [Tetrasphaera sp.]|uniref:hypothetical protein n=1 Tax=Nostocoides sp. TaxID=1917966 RepID=UPI002B6DD065|nr:hypothetical protein [Tetrasphaera sp.]HNQ08387.1 hypothetical protein [Tetrasphaera sp.]
MRTSKSRQRQSRTARLALGAAACAASLAGLASAPATARTEPAVNVATPGYLTMAWGRSLWAHGCNPGTPAPGVRTLEQDAQDLKAYGLRGVGGIVVNRTSDTRTCERGVTNATWADLARLQTAYGWSFVSQSMNYTRMTTLTTDAERYAETGATLAPLAARGHTQAWGAFFYPDDEQDLPAQQMVAKYFAFGRLYTLVPGFNTKASATVFPYTLLTYTPLGGRCNNTALPCYTIKVRNDRITAPPNAIVKALNPRPGQWSVIQMFRFVEGKSGTLGQANAWDCTSPDWRNRWTGIPENYCRNTFLTALAQRDRTVVNVTPAQMATRWGRTPSG